MADNQQLCLKHQPFWTSCASKPHQQQGFDCQGGHTSALTSYTASLSDVGLQLRQPDALVRALSVAHTGTKSQSR